MARARAYEGTMHNVAAFGLLLVVGACGGTRGVATAESMGPGHSPGQSEEVLQAQFGGRAPIDTVEGDATFYADSLAGNATASGERYDPEAFTAASPDLPFGSIVRVVRLDTGASVLVRVNDRTGGGATRIDLSRAAAEAVDMVQAGRVRVRVEVLETPPSRTR